jgi:hypothetical protein
MCEPWQHRPYLGPPVRLAKSLTRCRTRFTELQKLCEDLIVFMFRPCSIKQKALLATKGKETQKYQAR